MNILVCISRVPDTATKVNIGSDGKSIEEKGVKFTVNPYDEFGIEEGLQLKAKNAGSTVTALTVGTETSTDVLRTALAMGVDKAVLIKGSDKPVDSYYVAKNIANYVNETKPDLILMGRQSIDYDSFMMPSLLGELVDYPSVSVVSKIDIEGDKAKVERDIEGGKEVVEITLPCVMSAQKGLNSPRYPKLPDIMKAKKKPIEEIEAEVTEPKVSVLSMELPRTERVGKVMGDSDADIAELVRALKDDAKVI